MIKLNYCDVRDRNVESLADSGATAISLHVQRLDLSGYLERQTYQKEANALQVLFKVLVTGLHSLRLP